MHTKRPEGPALSRQCPPVPGAVPAQVQLASPVYPVDPVPCADRRPAPITRLIHLPPPAGPPPGPCPAATILTATTSNLLPRPRRLSRPSSTTPGHHRESPFTSSERPPPCQIRARPRRTTAIEDGAKHLQAGPACQIERRHPIRTAVIIAGMGGRSPEALVNPAQRASGDYVIDLAAKARRPVRGG